MFKLRMDRADLIRAAVVLHDLLAAATAFVLSVYVPLGTFSPDHLVSLVGYVTLFGITAAFVGLNRGIWRYASLADLHAILITTTATTAAFAVTVFLLNRLNAMPRSSLVLCWLLTIILLSGSRIGAIANSW